MKLSHYTRADEPLRLDTDLTYAADKEPQYFKPYGLWLSVDGRDDWPAFISGEKWDEGRIARRFIITLPPRLNVLRLKTLSALHNFTEKYQFTPPGVPQSEWLNHFIDWGKVKSAYDGIIISPYQWRARLSEGTFWYYPWDCASGCVWNLAGVTAAEDTNWHYQPEEKRA